MAARSVRSNASALLPSIMPIEQLPAANSLNMTVMMAGGIAGPLLFGKLIEDASASKDITAIALGYFIGAALMIAGIVLISVF